MEQLRRAIEFIFAFDLPVSNALVDVFLAVIPVTAAFIWGALVEVRFNARRWLAVTMVVLAAVATWTTFVVLSSPESHEAGGTILSFVIFLAMWGAFFHLVAWQYGDSLLIRFFGKHWIRCIDYVYLIGGIVGVLVTIVKMTQGIDADPSPQRIAILVLGIAIALRITKTTAEIKKWDDPPQRPPWPQFGREPGAGQPPDRGP